MQLHQTRVHTRPEQFPVGNQQEISTGVQVVHCITNLSKRKHHLNVDNLLLLFLWFVGGTWFSACSHNVAWFIFGRWHCALLSLTMSWFCCSHHRTSPDSRGHGANMEPIWGRQDPGGPHVGPMNLAIWVCLCRLIMLLSLTSHSKSADSRNLLQVSHHYYYPMLISRRYGESKYKHHFPNIILLAIIPCNLDSWKDGQVAHKHISGFGCCRS